LAKMQLCRFLSEPRWRGIFICFVPLGTSSSIAFKVLTMAEYAKLDEEHGEINRNSPGDTKRRFPRLGKGLPTDSHLSTPLNGSAQHGDGRFDSTDPYYVFQHDLVNKLELVDEALAEFLRVVHQTVRMNLSLQFLIYH
jgi:hypothetical protein